MEKHREGWIYSGQAADRLWDKSAIGRPLGETGLLLTGAEVIFCHEHRHLDLPSGWIGKAVQEHLELFDEAAILEALRVPGNKIVINHNLKELDVGHASLSWAARWPSDSHPRDNPPVAELRWFHASCELDVDDLYSWAAEVNSLGRICEIMVVDDEGSVVSYRVSSEAPSGELGGFSSDILDSISHREFRPISNGGVIILEDGEWPDERIGIPHPNGRMIDSTTSQMLYADDEGGETMGSSILRDLLMRGLHPRPGFKYGTRWRCYDKPLGQEHAPWLVVHPAEAPSDWEGACLASRLASGVGKTWLHPLIVGDSWEYLSISRPPPDSRWSNPNRR